MFLPSPSPCRGCFGPWAGGSPVRCAVGLPAGEAVPRAALLRHTDGVIFSFRLRTLRSAEARVCGGEPDRDTGLPLALPFIRAEAGDMLCCTRHRGEHERIVYMINARQATSAHASSLRQHDIWNVMGGARSALGQLRLRGRHERICAHNAHG